jgi:large subunit ribosomal protein L15
MVESETAMALAAKASSTPAPAEKIDEYGRQLFDHPQLRGIESLLDKSSALTTVDTTLTKWSLFGLASKYGIPAVLRWKPKKAVDPEKSGLDTVASQALYAIVGAVALERGGYEAKYLVREKILKPLKVVQI